ncbi:hypothetical protein GDO86_010899 [Hymenochirus boettgeri]|uniref:AN1-type domain-containing protein n=1 Tax=Hymenochirus boettgeri TaxID=247094 RepID=A0A8T2JH23_9PIPI|nr:hypothetical protein GDO86_010899 [Hymenochirus boettgeri]
MAELDIGQHCSAEHCGQLDFLPFQCDACSQVFCLEHRSKESHSCSQVASSASGRKSEESTIYLCMYEGCSEKELVPVLCPYCEKHFCLGHRHQSDHECDKLQVPKPRMVATQQLVKDIVDSKKSTSNCKVRKGAKNAETAAKVALMKLKLHAAGDKSLPQKLRLCHTATGEALPLDNTVETWISIPEHPLYNGGNIILEYLDNDSHSIEDIGSYLQ